MNTNTRTQDLIGTMEALRRKGATMTGRRGRHDHDDDNDDDGDDDDDDGDDDDGDVDVEEDK